MSLIRIAEEQLVQYYLKNRIMSFVHFYIGQEAVAVGVCDNLTVGDHALGNHRSHGHYLAKGGDLYAMVAELLGKSTGCCKGKGGSMHMVDRSVGFIGTSPILGSITPIAAGSAFTQKYTNSKNITVVFIGDGAAEEGVVYETINLAALHKLPLLIVVENNLYSVMSKLRDRRSENYSYDKIVTGLGAQYMRADGNNYEDVYNNAYNAIEAIKSGSGPVVLECTVYRHMAHSAPIFDDKIGYREVDTLENRLKECPIKRLQQELINHYNYTEEELNTLVNKEVLRTVENAIKLAELSPFPSQSTVFKDIV